MTETIHFIKVEGGNTNDLQLSYETTIYSSGGEDEENKYYYGTPIDHDYCIRSVDPRDLPYLKISNNATAAVVQNSSTSNSIPEEDSILKRFAKCDKCRKSRTKVLVPNSLISITNGKNDGVTCDFCGDIMEQVQPQTLPNVFEGRRGSKGGDLRKESSEDSKKKPRTKNYVYCGECGKVVLKESLNKHLRDVHEKSNKKQCHICHKMLSGPFSLKEHISAVHNKVAKHSCPRCFKTFAHFSNMNRHIRLVHDKMVVTHKYVNCPTCFKVVQSTSLKKHMSAIHEQRKDFKCEYCQKGFAQSYTLKEHIAAKHTMIHAYKCKLCGKTFAHKTNCSRHLKTIHKNEIYESGIESESDMVKLFVTTNETPNKEESIHFEVVEDIKPVIDA